MKNYIDGFVFPIAKANIVTYTAIAEQVAEIWKEYGALSYQEYIGTDMDLAGTASFAAALHADPDEVVVFGWVVFPSKEVRDEANAKVPTDARMEALVRPLLTGATTIFDARRMLYGGFQPLVQVGEIET